MRVTTTQYETSGKSHTFSQLKLNPPEHILPAREKNSLEKAAFLNKGYSYIHSFIHSFNPPLN